MKKRVGVIMFLIIIVLFILIILMVWWCISGNRIREYKGEMNSISSKEIVEINGVPNGLFINGKDISNPVLLLVSSGPGTDDRFRKDKIYIMGFSGGSRIAINAVHKYPDLFYAYIGMAQAVTDSSERDRLMYDYMRSVFEDRNDLVSLIKLEKSVHYENGEICCNDWRQFVMLLHKAGGGTTHNETEFVGVDLPIILSHCYTIPEKIGYIRGLKMYRNTAFEIETKGFDYRESLTEFEIPVYFVSGMYDYNCPQPLVEDYCKTVTAPDKKFYLIDDAAHSPLWENPEDSYEAFREIREKTYHEE